MTLATRISAAAEQPPRQALSTLLSIWRDHPHPRLSALVTRVSAQVPFEPIRERTQKKTGERFLELAAEPSDDKLAALLDVFPVGSMKAGLAQIDALSKWPRDPRLSSHLLGLFDDPPYRSPPALPFWQQLLAIVGRVDDPASAPVLAGLIERIDACFAVAMQGLMRRELGDMGALSVASDLADDARAALDRLEEAARKPPSSSDATGLLTAIYADPDDDELRLVYADACAAGSDPRGELIVIQQRRASGKRLSREQSVREKELLNDHRGEWLGNIERILLKSSIKFRLGFLDAATIKPKHDSHVRPLIGDERWSTVRDLEIKAVAEYHNEAAAGARASVEELVRHDVMWRLRRLTGDLSNELVIELCEGRLARQLETIEVSLWRDHGVNEVRAALASSSRLSELRELIYRHHGRVDPGDYDWLLDSEVGPRLSRLELRIGFEKLADWVTVFRASTFERLCLADSWAHNRIELDRSGAETAVRAHFRWPGMSRGGGGPIRGLADVLADLEPGSINRVEIGWTRSSPATEEQRAALEAALETLAPEHVKLPKK